MSLTGCCCCCCYVCLHQSRCVDSRVAILHLHYGYPHRINSRPCLVRKCHFNSANGVAMIAMMVVFKLDDSLLYKLSFLLLFRSARQLVMLPPFPDSRSPSPSPVTPTLMAFSPKAKLRREHTLAPRSSSSSLRPTVSFGAEHWGLPGSRRCIKQYMKRRAAALGSIPSGSLIGG